MINILNKELKYYSTQEIKDELLGLVKGRDVEPLNTKIGFYKIVIC